MSNDDHIPEGSTDQAPDGDDLPALEGSSSSRKKKEDDENLGKILKQTYRLDKKVGEGGMGNVYMATQYPLNRQVAIKMLKPNGRNPDGEHYFLREVQAINMLRHPNIINIVDFGKEPDSTLYLVMEFLPGKTLKRVIRKEYPLSPERICNICIQILSALQSAHDKEIVHCDLKPANIMLEEVAGQSDFVKVLDFGIAKVKSPSLESGPYTQAGNIVGTFDYMSPEQIMRKEVDGRADLWSLGVIMYEMLTRKRVFHDKDAVSIIGRVMQMPIASPLEVLGENSLPSGLNTIVMKAMQRNVEKRFQSAAEMRDALQQLQTMLKASSGEWAVLADSPYAFVQGADDSGALSDSLASSGLLQGTSSGVRSPTNPSSDGTSRTGLSSIISRSGGFGQTAAIVESPRLATGGAAGTSVLDQTFSIEALQDSLTGERRKVAVLAVQQRSRRKKGLDPEEMARRSKQEVAIIKEVVEHHDGEIDSFLGGTYTILFGARRTRVGDNVRAVECAYALQKRFQVLEQGFEHLGIGLTYGEIYLASRKGGNAFGEAIDRAVDIARSAKSAQIFVTDDLVNLTQARVMFDASRKVGDELVAEVLGLIEGGGHEHHSEPIELDDAALYVPRPTYFDELSRRADSAKRNQGGSVCVVGELGVGKTILLQRFSETLSSSGWETFVAGESELDPNAPFSAARVWISKIAQTYEDPRTLVRKACESLGLKEHIEGVVGLYLDKGGALQPQAAQLPLLRDPEQFGHFTAALLHRMVRFAMKKGPVLLVTDDLNLSHKQEMELLNRFTEQLHKVPVLILAGHRSDPTVALQRLPGNFEVLHIAAFDLHETRQFLAQLLGYTPEQEVVSQLHQRANGNPIFLKEIVRALLKLGGPQALRSRGILEAGIPLNLHELLAERIDQLPDHLRDLLSIASVMGESFLEAFFYQITPADLAPQLGLKELVTLHILDARGDMFGRVQVGFHPRALRNVIYERIPMDTRHQLHATIIEFLEAHAEDAAVDAIDLPLMLAFHYRSIERAEGAAHYLVRAGELFLDMYDYEAAIAQLGEAVELLKGSAARNHDLRILAETVLLTSMREAGLIEDAQAIIETLPPMEEIHPQFHARLLLEIGQVGMEAGSMERSMDSLSRVVQLAEQQGDTKLEVKGLLGMAQLFDKENQLQRAINVLVQVSQKVEQIGDLNMQDPEDRRLYWTAYNQIGTLSLRQHDVQQAQQYLVSALQRAQQIRDHRGLMRVASNIGALFLTMRDIDQAEVYFAQAFELAKAIGDLLNQARILTNRGIAAFEGHDYDQAKKHYRAARTIAEEIGWYEGLAELSLRIKQLRKALHG
ncbi:MAG: protein kinase [Myxococcota bacterium]